MAGLPRKVQLHQEYLDDGLVVIALNMEGQVKLEQVEPMIGRLGIEDLHNWLLAEGMTEAANSAVECDGLIPQINLYDRQGRLRHENLDELEPDELDGLIRELLQETSG